MLVFIESMVLLAAAFYTMASNTKLMNKILIFFLVLSITSFAQTYKQVKIFLSAKEDMQTLASFNLDLDHVQLTKDNAIITFLNEAECSRLALLNFRYEILLDDWQAYYNKLPRMNALEKQTALSKSKNKFGVTNFGYGSMGGFYTYDEVVQKLDEMKSLYPNLITSKNEIGKTEEQRPIYSVKISDNPDTDEDEPEVLYTALIHAREPESMMQMLYFMFYLLENYGADAEVTYLVNNRELYFIPVINPDGYAYNQTTFPDGGGMWRKNRKNNGNSFGVDLNRNFGPVNYWNAPNGGSSAIASEETYRGPSPFSEKETECLVNFLTGRKIKNALNYHTYGNLLVYPYGALEKETADSLIFREYATDMTKSNRYATGTDQSTVGYSTRGNSDDYMYDGDSSTFGKIFAMTPEVGNSLDGFWPPQARILPLAEENLFPNLYYAWVAGGYVSLADYSFDRETFFAGDTVCLTSVIKNKGLNDAANVGFSVKADTSLTAISSEQSGLNLKSRESYVVNPVFILSPNLKNGDVVKLIVSTTLASIPMSKDTIAFTIGEQQIVFEDTSLSPVDKWNLTSNNPVKWDAATSNFKTAPTSFTDSPGGLYPNSATIVMTLKDSINLLNISAPKLTFWTKFDLEKDWDCGVVGISSDKGKTWTSVGGKFASMAVGQGRQAQLNSPVYDGVQRDWVKEEIDLNEFAGKEIKIRFSVLSDETIPKDGWYLDDIRIITYGNVTAVKANEGDVPQRFYLSQNYPNPFNPNTVIGWRLAAGSNVTLKVYDVLGDEVAVLVNEYKPAGNYKIEFNAAKLSSGVYFYRLVTSDFIGTKKMVLLR